MFKKELPGGLLLQQSEARYAKELDVLQQQVFPTLAEAERMTAKHYLHHLQVFPEGQLLILDGEKVIAATSTMRTQLILDDHSFLEISDNLWFNTHQPEGEWLYDMDIGIHPDYRGRGLARQLYRAKQEICRELKLKGQIIVGMPIGYGAYQQEMTIEAYYEMLLKGEIFDPTVSTQMRMGAIPQRLIANYLNDPECGNGGVLMLLPVETIV